MSGKYKLNLPIALPETRSINANAAELPWFHDASDALEVEQVGGMCRYVGRVKRNQLLLEVSQWLKLI